MATVTTSTTSTTTLSLVKNALKGGVKRTASQIASSTGRDVSGVYRALKALGAKNTNGLYSMSGSSTNSKQAKSTARTVRSAKAQ